MPDIPICKDFCRDTLLWEGFSGGGARYRCAGQDGVIIHTIL